MKSPAAYFTDPKEKELALLVWEKGREMAAKNQVSTSITRFYLSLEGNSDARTLVAASDWISLNRGDGEEGGTDAVCAAFGKPHDYFSDLQIANVEHVYRAAYLSVVITPAGSFLGAAAWELAIDPWLKEPLMRAWEAQKDLSGAEAFSAFMNALELKLAESYRRNGAQFLDVDLKGWMFGADFWQRLVTDPASTRPGAPPFDSQQALRELRAGLAAFDASAAAAGAGAARQERPPTPGLPSDEMEPWVVDKAGLMLSVVSLKRYDTYHYWPLIWDNNRDKIGSNPNRVPMGITLRIKKLSAYTPAQLNDARVRSPKWASFK